MPRSVAVIVRRPPFGSDRSCEALRMAVGLTTGDHEIAVVFLGDGVLTLRALDPLAAGADDIGQHLEACAMLGVRLVAEGEALGRHGVEPALAVERLPFGEAASLIKSAEVVIPF